MITVVMVGILASTAATAFGTYQTRSKASEAPMALSKMAQGEAQYYAKNTTFLTAGPTNIPPAGPRQTINFATDPNWALLNFGYSDAIYFGYQATIVDPTQVDCEAMGDLNGDGSTSIYRRTVAADSDGLITIGGLYIFDELE